MTGARMNKALGRWPSNETMTKKRLPDQSPELARASTLPRNLLAAIRRRERIARAIEATRAQIADVRRQMRDLEQVKRDLAAIDRTLGFHRIQVDPENIPPIRNHYKRLNLAYGELSRCIFEAIRQYAGPTPRAAIFHFVASRHPHLAQNEQSIAELKRSLHDRLKDLAREGRVVRHHAPQGGQDGIWSLRDSAV